MKLNQHGWNMREMILLSSILFAFLLLLVFMVLQIQQGMQTNNNTSNVKIDLEAYENLEWIILNVAIDYYGENYDGDETIRVTTSKLVKENYLNASDLEVDGDACSGYVTFSEIDPSVYIRCKYYKTSGYKE